MKERKSKHPLSVAEMREKAVDPKTPARERKALGRKLVKLTEAGRPKTAPVAGPVSVTIQWTHVKEELPDPDITVLIHMPGSKGDPVWMGYYDEPIWRQVDGMALTGDNRVTHWAHLPEAPEER